MDLLNLAKQINVTVKHSNLDYAYGPYYNEKDDDGQIIKTSVQVAAESTQYIKAIGLTVLCENEDGTFTEYWYKDNTDKLVKKVNVIDISKLESSIIFSGYDTDTDGEYSDYVINFIEQIYITPYNKSTLTIGDEFPVDDIENTENTENTENIE